MERDLQKSIPAYEAWARFKITLLNRLIRLTGNVSKLACYPFHLLFPKKRFCIPEFSPARVRQRNDVAVPKVIWQTNYSSACTLPVYLNYLFNRWMSRDFDYRYVSTEARAQFMQENASHDVYEAYTKLTDGAAQADLWRVVVLYLKGGVYMDIDATLVLPLHAILKGITPGLFIKIKGNKEITNFFLATVAGNACYQSVIDKIVDNINNHDGTTRAYSTTGPVVFNQVLADLSITTRSHRYVCIQGAFTNEYFQYADKPRGKWTYQDPKHLVNNENDLES